MTSGTAPPVDAEELLRDMRVGSPGDEAVADLRAAGFVVYDYQACSDSVPAAGRLGEVRLTESRTVLLDSDGTTSAASTAESPAALDVLITNGDPCSRPG